MDYFSTKTGFLNHDNSNYKIRTAVWFSGEATGGKCLLCCQYKIGFFTDFFLILCTCMCVGVGVLVYVRCESVRTTLGMVP